MFGRHGVASRRYHSCKSGRTIHGKNIEFVSISVDNIKDREKWSNLVDTKHLGEFNYWQIRTYILILFFKIWYFQILFY
jgi:hypothetical protein